VVWVAVFQRNILLASSGSCLMLEEVCFFGNSIHTRLFGVGAEGQFHCFLIESEDMKWRGDGVWYGMVVLGV
jgi:hypothetical protein